MSSLESIINDNWTEQVYNSCIKQIDICGVEDEVQTIRYLHRDYR